MSIGDVYTYGSKIYEIIGPTIVRHCGYILFCKSHASDLKDEIQKLKDAAKRVQRTVDESRSDGEFIHEDVLTWLNTAELQIESGDCILEANKVGHVLGFIPDPVACHMLGRNATKAIPDFQNLCSKGVFNDVSYRHVESLIVGASTSSQRNYVPLKSRDAVLKFVMEALDDDKISAIGVYGMGGVGKTTLLKQVENEAKKSKKFEGVFNVFVSQTPNLTAIRAEIDYRVKRLGSNDSRKTVLILFDDIWKPLDLKDLRVPESNNKLKVKLVMTSRNKHLLANEMSCRRTFSVGVLDVEEAWHFFAKLVDSNVADLKGKPAVVAFLKKCAGLPVSIEALATLWKKKKMDSSSSNLSEDELIKYAKESPDGFVSLELSYNSLEDGYEENQAKLVFRTIGLLNTPKVPVLTLIKYIVGLGLFGSSTNNIVERARMEITRSLRTLQESSLLLESEDSDHVKIHDVVRDVAVGIASKEDHALIFDPLKGVKEWSKEKLKECKAVSLTSSALLELRAGWNSPDLNIFVLEAGAEQGDHHVELPEAKDMVKLRVIHLKNIAQFTSLPPSINPDLQNLTTLCLENCCLKDITVIGKLVTLQVLSLTGPDLAELPKEIGELTNLRMLDLSKCSMLVFIEPGILERLTKLEELYLRESFDKWGVEGDGGKCNAGLEELNSMPRLRTLEVHIRDTSKLPQNLPLGDLVQSKVLMGESWDWSGEYTESRTLKLEVKWDRMINEEWFQSALQKTQDLHLEGLDGAGESFHELCRKGFQELKHLHLQNSSSTVCIVWSLEWLECSAFTVLESMVLENMGSLEKICYGRISLSSFSKLKVVRVQKCHKLRSIFSLSLLKNLTELEEIEISDCKVVRQIVIEENMESNDGEEIDHAGEEQNVGMNGCCSIFFGGGDPTKSPTTDAEEGATAANNAIAMVLGNLRHLTLRKLPEITSFFTTEGGGPSDETSMETSVAPVFFNEQKVFQPPRYKEIQSTTRLALDKLHRIELIDCKSVVHFTNSQVLLKLVNLESLTIEGCASLKDIFDLEGIEPESGNVEILPNLYELKLRQLPKLKDIWKNNHKQIKGCRKLRTVEIYGCDNLLYFSSSFMCEVMESLTEINVGDCEKMEKIFLEEEGQESNAPSVKTQLTSLKILAISNCPNLTTFSGIRRTASNGSPSGLNVSASTDSTCNNKGMAYWCCGGQAVDTTTVDTSNSFFNQKVFLPSLESLILNSAGEFEKLWCGEIPDQSYCNLEYVHVEHCEKLLAVIPASMIQRLHNLKQIWVTRCSKLKFVFDLDVDWKAKVKSKALMLPQLQEVKLRELGSLTHVMERGSEDEIVVGFPSLNGLTVYECKRLINLISTTTATTLLELTSLDISKCSGLLEVIGGEISERRYRRNAITFPYLTSLTLTSLESLTCFSSESHHRFDFPCLRILKIDECKSFKRLIKPRSDGRLGSQDEEDQANTATQVLFSEKIQLPSLEELYVSNSDLLEELWDDEPPPTTSSFYKLKLLKISGCSRLQNVIPSFMVNRLQNLERLSILECDSLQDIFKTTSSTKQILQLAFTKLTSLELRGNLKLSNMWSGSYTLEMPSLKTLVFNRTDGAAVEAIMEKVHLPNLDELEFHFLEITEVWQTEPHVGSFSKLKRLQVQACGALEKIIPLFMLKRLQNLEKLVVTDCKNLEIICDQLEWLLDVQDSESKLASFPFPNLASIHVEKCERLRSLFSISGRHHQYGETADDSDHKFVLPKLVCLRLESLPTFSHLIQQEGQYALELPFLEEFFLIEAGDEEAVTHKVAFPEEVAIQVSDMPKFFGTTSSVVSDIVKALEQKNQVIIGLLGEMEDSMQLELKQQVLVKEEAANHLFDQVVHCSAEVYLIQANLKIGLGMVYGETDVEGQAKRVHQNVLSYIGNKRLLLILAVPWNNDNPVGNLKAAGIPLDLLDREHFKIILVCDREEVLVKMNVQLSIPIGECIENQWEILKKELEHSHLEIPEYDDTKTYHDISSFVGPNTALFNNIMQALRSHQSNNQIIGMLGLTTSNIEYLKEEVVRLAFDEEEVFSDMVVSQGTEVDKIQEALKRQLDNTSSSSSSETTVQLNRILFVFQGIDKELDLEAVGIPLDHPKVFKIILISEKRDVLQKMGIQRVFEFESEFTQSDDEFCRMLDGYMKDSDLKKIADECGSSKDLMKLLAKKLKGQGMHAWANAFRRLKESPFEYEERRKVIVSL